MHVVASRIERHAGLGQLAEVPGDPGVVASAPCCQQLPECEILVCGHGNQATNRAVGAQLGIHVCRPNSSDDACDSKAIGIETFESIIRIMIDLDDINIELLDLLQEDCRMSYRELGERVGLSAPAVTERIRRLEEMGIIKGYRVDVDYEALGFPLLCVIRLNSPRGASEVDEVIENMPEVIESNRVTGSESHVLRARARSTGHLEDLLHELWSYGDSNTNIVTSSPVPRRPMHLRRALARNSTPLRRALARRTGIT